MANWNNFAGGLWNSAGNWDTGSVPNAIDAVANFAKFQQAQGQDIIDLNSGSFRVGTLGLTSTSGDHYRLYNGTVIMQVTSGNAAINVTTSGGGTPLASSVDNLRLDSTTTITTTGTGAELYAGVVSGTGGLTKAGTGTLWLSGTNTFTGATTINDGTVYLDNGNALATSSGVTMSTGAQLALFYERFVPTFSIKNLAGSGGTIFVPTATSSSLTLTNGDGVFAGSLQDGAGTLSLIKNGSGVTYLSGANTYSGGTTVNGGILLMGNGGSTSGTVGTGAVAINSGIFALFRTGDYTFANTITGTANFDKNIAGTATLTGANSGFTGTFTVNTGTLKSGGAATLGNDAAMIVNAGATLDLTNQSHTFRTLSGSGTILSSVGIAAAITIDGAADSTFSGAIGTDVSLYNNGSGTFTLSGASDTRIVAVNGGTLALSGAGSISISTVAINAGATFDISGTATGATVLQIYGTGGDIVTGGKTLTVTAQFKDPDRLRLVGGTGTDVLLITLASTSFDDTLSLDQLTFANWDAGTDQIILIGNANANTLTGSSQNDNISGGSANDTLEGGGGNDTLHGDGGSDRLDGGAGDDVIIYDPGDQLAFVFGGADNDTLYVTNNQPPPTTFDLAGQGFEGAKVFTSDTGGNWWQSIEDVYTASWQRATSRTTADDFATVTTSYDISAGGTGVNWQYISDYRNASSVLTNQDGKFDNGGSFAKSYDYAAGTGTDGISDELSEFTYFFANDTDRAANKVLNVEGFYDDGRKFTQTNDIGPGANGDHAWTFQTNWYETDGVTLDFLEIRWDNGSTQIIPY